MPLTDRMPTATRLVSALCLGGLGWIASEMIRPLMPPETAFGWFNWVNVALGVLCGWFVLGPRSGRGYGEAIGAGLTGLGALVFWALFAQSFYEMISRSLDRRYDGPVEALIGIFENAMELGQHVIDLPLIATLIGGGILSGFVAEFVARRWT
jgi:hypothetical protein